MLYGKKFSLGERARVFLCALVFAVFDGTKHFDGVLVTFWFSLSMCGFIYLKLQKGSFDAL